MNAATTISHPARFSIELLPVLREALRSWSLPVHDPYGGTGERLGAVCDELNLAFSGTEIEPEFIVDRRVKPGDSTDPGTYPDGRYVVCTSPSYPNGMSDHFHARDGSRRHTYRQALASIVGHDRPLAANNTGRYGIRSGKRAEARYWDLQRRVVGHWPACVIVNVKDFYHKNDQLYPLVDRWVSLLAAWDYRVLRRVDVPCPGQRHGENRHRSETEAVLVCER